MGFVVLHMEKAHGSDSGTTAPPPTDRKGKNKVGLRGSRRHAAGYLRRKYRSLLGNFPSRNTMYR